jgi:hypothetical protein
MPADGSKGGAKRPQRADWRGGGKANTPAKPAAAGAGAGGKGPDWTRRKGYDAEKLLWVFRAKVAAGVLLAVVLFVVLIRMLRGPATTPFISLVLASYQYPVPPNAYAYDDLENIRSVLTRERGQGTGGEPLSITDERQIAYSVDKDDWLDQLRRQVEAAATIKWYQGLGQGPGDGVVIIYLAGHGVVDDDGHACLLLPQQFDSDNLFDPARRLPMRELLDTLFYDRSNQKQKLPKNVLKFVVLDANRIGQNWELGLPYNAFVESLRKTVESDLPVSNLFVLNSADAGQLAWASPELGGSVFGHFLKRGLQGHADGYAEKATVRATDNKVSVDELFEYVRQQTARFVATFRGDEQRPILLATSETGEDARQRPLVEYGSELLKVDDPHGEDFSKARANRLESIGKKWAEVRREGWDYYAALQPVGVRRHPLAWQRFQDQLIRLDQLAAAGDAAAYVSQFTAGVKNLKELRNQIVEPPASVEYPNSIALATAIGANKFANKSKELDAAAATYAGGKDVLEGSDAADYAFRAQAVWRTVLAAPGDGQLAALLDRAANKLLPTDKDWLIEREPVEIQFMRMLAAHRNQREPFNPGAVSAALKRRNEAELASAPLDERVHYWSRPSASRGDDQRRRAEDLLFVGRVADLEQAKAEGAAADQFYANAKFVAAALTKAYELRDQILSDTPWLLRYHARRFETNGQTVSSDQAITALLNVHHDAMQLVGDFQDSKPNVKGEYDVNDINHLVKATTDLRTTFDGLRKPVLQALSQRAARSSDADRRRVLDAMAMPFLSGAAREALHAQAVQLFGKDFVYSDLSPNESEQASAAASNSIDHHLRRMLAWKVHPALALASLSGDDVRASDVPSLIAAGRRLRTKIAELNDRVAAAQKVPGNLSLGDGVSPPSERAELADIDLAVRAAGYFRGKPPALSPAERMRRFDRQRLLVWHYQRALDDFWGPAPQRLEKNFFQVAAQRCVQLARSQDDLVTTKNPQAAKYDDVLRKGLLARENAAGGGLTPHFEPAQMEIKVDLMSSGKQTADHQVNIVQAPGADLPRGIAAYYLSEANDAQTKAADKDPKLLALSGKQVDTQPTRLPYAIDRIIPVGSDGSSPPLKYKLQDPRKQYDDARFLRGIALFRGHRFRDPSQLVMLVPYGCDRGFDFVPPAYDPPTIEVAGPEKPRAVLLVLDCSSSMRKTAEGKTRVAIAKDVLTRVIDELQQSGTEVQVGFWLYGHRTRYKRELGANQAPTETEPLDASEYANEFGGKDIPPPDDVEEAVKLAKLTPQLKAEIFKRLEKAQPHGYTPLYLSIQRAVAEGFASLKGNTNVQRQVLVLTDGANTQCAADPRVKAPAHVVVDAGALEAALRDNAKQDKSQQVRVDVVGFEFDDGVKTKAGNQWIMGDMAELRGILDKTDGVFTAISRQVVEDETPLDRLLDSLRQRLGIFRFRIVDAASHEPIRLIVDGQMSRGPLVLNRKAIVADAKDRKSKLLVQFESLLKRDAKAPVDDYPFELRDRGEQLLLRVQENRIVGGYERWLNQEDTFRDPREYRVGDRETRGDDLKDLAGNQIFIFPRSAKWDQASAGLRFRLAVRYPDGRQFTPQPVEAFAVVQPQLNDVAPFTIFDMTFDPGMPAPEMSFVVPNWREKANGAKRAVVWVWFKFDRATTPMRKIRVDATTINPVEIAGKQINYSVDYGRDEGSGGFVVHVTERHADKSTLDQVKVSMEDQPSRIHRCYVTGGKEIVNTFYYRESQGLTLEKLRQFNILLTSVQDMKANSIHVHEREDRAMLIDTNLSR